VCVCVFRFLFEGICICVRVCVQVSHCVCVCVFERERESLHAFMIGLMSVRINWSEINEWLSVNVSLRKIWEKMLTNVKNSSQSSTDSESFFPFQILLPVVIYIKRDSLTNICFFDLETKGLKRITWGKRSSLFRKEYRYENT